MKQKLNVEEISFQLILHAGNARSLTMEAIQAAKKGDFVTAKKNILDAGTELHIAHTVQTDLLQAEANKPTHTPTILLIHAQDHLMNAISIKDLAEEMIDLYKRL